MPYNNTPIAPTAEPSGVVSLPLARVKKIIHADEDIANCSNNAAFVITIATEMFIQHLVAKTHEIIRSEKKPRRNVQYHDVANAVARLDNLEFLGDVVPRTTTFKKYKEERARKETTQQGRPLANGQTRLTTAGTSEPSAAGISHLVSPDQIEAGEDRMQVDDEDPSAMQLDAEATQEQTNETHE